ncbi:MAG: helix-turn-helix transcriptional regulator [Opitutaceae bacterium]
MPKSSNHLALARQWEMLKALPSRAPGITAREITDNLKEAGYEVTKRTVERDLNDLSGQFGIGCNTSSMPYGWYWLPGQQQAFGSVGLMDSVSLTLAEGVLKQMLPPSMVEVLQPKFEQAKAKLTAVSANPLAKLSKKVRYVPTTLQFEAPLVRPQIMERIQEALVRELQVAVRYAPFEAGSKKLRLHPLCLVQRGNVSYLLAITFDYTNVLLYAVHRFETVEVLQDPIQPPVGFSVDAHLASGVMEFGGGKEITFKAKLSNQLAIYLAETRLHPEQKIQYRDGGYQLTAKVRDSWQLQFWIMSQGPDIEVTAPKALRARVRSNLAAALGHY